MEGIINVQKGNRSIQGKRIANNQARTNTAHRTTGRDSQHIDARSPRQSSSHNRVISCRQCNSTQIVANKRGYSFSQLFITLAIMVGIPLLLFLLSAVAVQYIMNTSVPVGSSSTLHVSASRSSSTGGSMVMSIVSVLCWLSVILSLPVSILVGFVGRSKITNHCMNCGFTWKPKFKKK